MGIFTSRLAYSANAKFFGFDDQIEFRKEQLGQQIRASSAKQAEMLAQLPLGGGAPGGGGGGQGGFPPGGQIQGQINLTKVLTSFAPWMAMFGISLSVYAFIKKLDRGILFIGLFFACFFSIFQLSFLFNVSQTNNLTGSPIMTSVVVMSIVISFFVAFVLYEPGTPAVDAAGPQLSAAEIELLKMKARETNK